MITSLTVNTTSSFNDTTHSNARVSFLLTSHNFSSEREQIVNHILSGCIEVQDGSLSLTHTHRERERERERDVLEKSTTISILTCIQDI